jgi:alkylated DNA nucleotide flippase Atl1
MPDVTSASRPPARPSSRSSGTSSDRTSSGSSATSRSPRGEESAYGLPTPFAEAVLDLVDTIPRGRVMAYGDVAAVLGSGGARAVGTVMARFGSGVPWHRVVRSDGSPPAGHEAEALRRHRAERTPLLPGGTRINMQRARWTPTSPPPPHR